MALLTYEQVRPWARAIQEAVALNRMPPWFADPEFGKWTNAHEMAQQDRDTILNWVESDAKRGNPEDAPEPLTFVEGWNIDEPDVVLELPHAFEVPAEGTIDYHYVVIPTGFEEDKWVTAAEIRPGNREVVHHVIAFMRPADSHWLEEAKPGEILSLPGMSQKRARKKAMNTVNYWLVLHPACRLHPGARNTQNCCQSARISSCNFITLPMARKSWIAPRSV